MPEADYYPLRMSTQAIMTLPMSRPKVHRPPVFREDTGVRRPLYITVVSLAMLSMLALWAMNQKPALTEMKTVIEPAQHVELVKLEAAKPPATIIIQEGDQSIIGQMAKIPVQNKTTADIQTVTSLDKEDGKELLSIVNKY